VKLLHPRPQAAHVGSGQLPAAQPRGQLQREVKIAPLAFTDLGGKVVLVAKLQLRDPGARSSRFTWPALTELGPMSDLPLLSAAAGSGLA